MNVPDSVMDAGMEDVEIMVNAMRKPNSLNLKALSALYYARAVSYWRKVEEFYEDINNVEDPQKRRNFHKIKSNLPRHKDKFESLLGATTYELNHLETITDTYFNVFLYMSYLLCVEKPDVTRHSTPSHFYDRGFNDNCKLKDKYKIVDFPFVNHTGEPGLNTYLYAIFNNVSLIGIPSKNYDNTRGCSHDFYKHGLSPVKRYRDHMTEFPLLCKLYKAVLNSDHSESDKKLAVIIIWTSLHENIPIFSARGKLISRKEFLETLDLEGKIRGYDILNELLN